VDVEQLKVSGPGDFLATFAISDFQRYSLLNGLDDIDLSLEHEKLITSYEERRSIWIR